MRKLMWRRRPKPQDALEDFFRRLTIPAGERQDPALDLAKTPHRIAKMFSEELLASYKEGAFEDLRRRFTCFPSDGKDALVLLGPIDFTSICAHHALPFAGEAYVGYVPDELVVGASKIPRVVEFFSRMFQIQERMARQVVDFIHREAGAKLVIGLFLASHECMRCRGVRQRNTRMATTAISPQPQGPEDHSQRGVIAEFYSQVDILRR